MVVCNSHSGRQKNSVSSYEAVFGHKYHPQLKCNMPEMRECWSIIQRLKMSLDERQETYVRQHDIVDIELDCAEYAEDDEVDDIDKEEGVDIDENAFLELKLEENDVQLGNLNSNDGLGVTAWATLVCTTKMGMTTVSIVFLLSTHLPLLWTHLLCTVNLRWTVHHPWIMSPHNLQCSVSGNVLHSQFKRHGITATSHGTASHWWAVATSFNSFGQC